jgi:hypothetical protein
VSARRVRILGGMAEFIGKTGTVIGEEGSRPVMLRVSLDEPVEVEGVGLVRDDLWERRLLETVRPTLPVVDEFRAALEAKVRKGAGHERLEIELQPGRRYTRIVRKTRNAAGMTLERSVYGFIDTRTGALLKAHGWKGPAKGARGNLADADPLARCDQYSLR